MLASLLLACDGDDDTGSTVDVTAGTSAATVGGQEGSTVPPAGAELQVEASVGGEELTIRYGGRLAQVRWPFAEVYKVGESGSIIQVGWLVLDGDVGTYQRYEGRPLRHREGTTHGGPGPEVYPFDLPPGDYRICAEVVAPGAVLEVLCADFAMPG